MANKNLIMIPYLNYDNVIVDFNLTPYILSSSYICNTDDEFESYKDANYKNHYYKVRERIKGSCELLINSETTLKEFFRILTINKKDGHIYLNKSENPITSYMKVYVINKSEVKEIECKLSATQPKLKKINQGYDNKTSYINFKFEFEEV